MRFAPARILRQWVYSGMDFDEMYLSVFAGFTIGASRFLAATDRMLADPLAGISAWVVHRFPHTRTLSQPLATGELLSAPSSLSPDIDSTASVRINSRTAIYIALLILSMVLIITAGIAMVLSK